MYTMVMMMAMSGSADATGFGHKMRGGCNGMSCTGVAVVASGCTGVAPAAVVAPAGCTGCGGSMSCNGSTSCNGCGGGSGFLGLRGHFSRKMRGGSSCSGMAAPSTGCTGYSTGCTGCTGMAAPTDVYSTGCVGSVITGGTPGAVMTEGAPPAVTPAPKTVDMPKTKDAPKAAPATPKAIDKTGDGV